MAKKRSMLGGIGGFLQRHWIKVIVILAIGALVPAVRNMMEKGKDTITGMIKKN